MRTWYNRHFACVARVIQELRRSEPRLPLSILVSHRHSHFAGYAVADERFLEPAGLDADRYLEWVLEIVRMRRVDVLVPGHEQSFLTAHAGAIAAAGCRLMAAAPSEFLPRIHRKDLVYADVAELVDLPRYAVCNAVTEARRLVEEIEDGGRHEVCLKPCVSVYGKGFTRVTSLPQRATSSCPLVDHWAHLQAASPVFSPHIVMEFLPGHEYSVDIAARDGSTLAAVVRQKPLVAGGQLLADMPLLIDAATRLVRRYRLNALVNVQFREDVSGQPRLLEINPRASGGIGMSCLSGMNLPAIAFRAFLEPDWLPALRRPVLGQRVLEVPQAMICPDADPVQPEWREDAGRGKPPQADTFTVDLPTGTLSLAIDRDIEAPIGELLGFGARRNPRRGFLLISKVLGKHWPCRPDAMARLHRRLAEKLVGAGLGNGDVVVIGMAETATGLGQGVFESLLDLRGPQSGSVLLQTTRYIPTAGDQWMIEFGEPHSHGPRLVLPLPTTEPMLARCRTADTLVICDDEVSTGTTLANLVAAARMKLPGIRRVFVATIADLSGKACAEGIASLDGIQHAAVVSMAAGQYEFTRNPDFDLGSPPEPSPLESLAACSRNSTRIGRSNRLELGESIVDDCLRWIPSGRMPVLVVGTGEFMYPAFRLACALESRGVECRVQATSRSPLLVAGDIRAILPVPDLNGGAVPHFLYNFDSSLYRFVIVVHESTDAGAVARLCALLGDGTGCLSLDPFTGCVRQFPEIEKTGRLPPATVRRIPRGLP